MSPPIVGHSLFCQFTFVTMFLLAVAVLLRNAFAAAEDARAGGLWLALGYLAGIVLPIKGLNFLMRPEGGYLMFGVFGICVGITALAVTVLANRRYFAARARGGVDDELRRAAMARGESTTARRLRESAAG